MSNETYETHETRTEKKTPLSPHRYTRRIHRPKAETHVKLIACTATRINKATLTTTMTLTGTPSGSLPTSAPTSPLNLVTPQVMSPDIFSCLASDIMFVFPSRASPETLSWHLHRVRPAPRFPHRRPPRPPHPPPPTASCSRPAAPPPQHNGRQRSSSRAASSDSSRPV